MNTHTSTPFRIDSDSSNRPDSHSNPAPHRISLPKASVIPRSVVKYHNKQHSGKYRSECDVDLRWISQCSSASASTVHSVSTATRSAGLTCVDMKGSGARKEWSHGTYLS